MSDTAWLVVAVTAGAVFAVFGITRELWIHRRRRRVRAKRSERE